MRTDLPAHEMWRKRAACKGMSRDDYQLFIPTEVHSSHAREAYRMARLICAECPVREACLQYAIDNQIQFGIWGGTSPEERGLRTDNAPGLHEFEEFTGSSWKPSPSDLWLEPGGDWELYDFTFSKAELEATAAARKRRTSILARIDAELAELDALNEKEPA